MKHIPMRTCIVCRTEKGKSELCRTVKTPDNRLILDTDGKAQGRGAYVCKDGDCMQTAIKKRMFNRAFKQNLSPQVYEEFEKSFSGADDAG